MKEKTNLIEKEKVIEYLLEEGDGVKKEHGWNKVEPIKPGHGSCCTCQTCGRWHDDCVCIHNYTIDSFEKFFKENCLKLRKLA